jgi:hypothetical protein
LYSNKKYGLQQIQMENCQPIKRLMDKKKKKKKKKSVSVHVGQGTQQANISTFLVHLLR